MAQKFATYSTAGLITGFYDAVDSPAPAGVPAIAITDAQWKAALTTPGYTVQSGVLTAPTAAALLAAAQSLQSSQLSQSCASVITGGYPSVALGAANTYGSQSTDQQNLTDAMNASLVSGLAAGWTTLLWCAPSSGAWALTPHSAPQVQQVHADWLAFRLAQQNKLVTFKAQANAAATIAAVQAIVWS